MSQVTTPSLRPAATLASHFRACEGNRLVAALLFVCCLFFASSATRAQQIDLSLNVFYNDPTNLNSGGTWEVVGKSSDSGIYALLINLAGINGAIAHEAPTATINGNPGSGGLQLQGVAPQLGPGNQLTHYQITLGQQPIVNTPGEQTIFYGIGTLENGSPAFAGQMANTTSLGPTFATLANPINIPWATGDTFGDSDWDLAASLISGTFSNGTNPSFFVSQGQSAAGVVLTSVGNSTTAGTRSNFLSTTVTSILRSNFANGDFNGDGFVDAADYTVWRDTLGSAVPLGTGADGNGDGFITAADYSVWRSLFGTTNTGSGSLGPTAGASVVPEPTAKTHLILTLLVVGALFSQIRMRAASTTPSTTPSRKNEVETRSNRPATKNFGKTFSTPEKLLDSH